MGHLWLKWVGHLLYDLNGRCIYDLNGWGIYGSNGWGSYGKVSHSFLEEKFCALRSLLRLCSGIDSTLLSTVQAKMILESLPQTTVSLEQFSKLSMLKYDAGWLKLKVAIIRKHATLNFACTLAPPTFRGLVSCPYGTPFVTKPELLMVTT